MERVISSCSAKIPCISRSYVSVQMVNPSPALISSAVIRTRLPSRRTLPSSTCPTFNFDAISPSSVSLLLNQNEEPRGDTHSRVIMLSAERSYCVIPTLILLWFCDVHITVNGNREIDFSLDSSM